MRAILAILRALWYVTAVLFFPVVLAACAAYAFACWCRAQYRAHARTRTLTH